MREEDRLRYLKIALVVIGVFFIFGIYLMMNVIWPEGWGWTPRQYEYEQMIMGVYAVLGVFLIRPHGAGEPAGRRPGAVRGGGRAVGAHAAEGEGLIWPENLDRRGGLA